VEVVEEAADVRDLDQGRVPLDAEGRIDVEALAEQMRGTGGDWFVLTTIDGARPCSGAACYRRSWPAQRKACCSCSSCSRGEHDKRRHDGAVRGQWPRESQFPIVQRYHMAIRAVVAERFARAESVGGVVHDPAFELTREDFEKVEADLLATGYRFEVSAIVSSRKSPRGTSRSLRPSTPARCSTTTGPPNRRDRRQRVQHGRRDRCRAFHLHRRTVMEMLVEGVPEQTIAVIDDSGGTLTAPILADFAGVICLGGTSARI